MSAPDDAPKSALKIPLALGAVTYVAQMGLSADFPLPRTDLSHGLSIRYAKSCEAVEDRGTDLDLSNLPLEVSCGEALTRKFHTMHLRFDAASAVVSGQLSPQCAAQIL